VMDLSAQHAIMTLYQNAHCTSRLTKYRVIYIASQTSGSAMQGTASLVAIRIQPCKPLGTHSTASQVIMGALLLERKPHEDRLRRLADDAKFIHISEVSCKPGSAKIVS
jgi:hypothetical protein